MKALLSSTISFLLVASACTAANPKPDPTAGVTKADDLVLAHGDEIGGDVQCRRFVVPAGATVHTTSRLTVSAWESIRIDGVLLGADMLREEPASVHDVPSSLEGPTIFLQARDEIRITGEIRGGRGADVGSWRSPVFRGWSGGDGASIFLRAPTMFIDGQVVGGSGGAAAPGGNGSKGGDVTIYGNSYQLAPDDAPELIGGMGGLGGRGVHAEIIDGVAYPELPAGNGGAGGGVFHVGSDEEH